LRKILFYTADYAIYIVKFEIRIVEFEVGGAVSKIVRDSLRNISIHIYMKYVLVII
jgi:hypothetical protein